MAIKAAGDAAAELVKTAALEEFKKTNDEKAAVMSASKANAIEAAGYGVGICAEYGRGALRPYVGVKYVLRA
ncbi:hypothetical protein HanOQP8_Chr01g0008501 [Helianthus annuus]|nr:hypothetical protein HanOQP8_Chr01g0008501 [Helianthus annuus]